jgi:hypothetical protein
MVERIVRGGKAVRSAPNREPLPFTTLAATRLRNIREIEIHVVGDKYIEQPVAIVIDKRAAGSPASARHREPSALSDVLEFTVSEIPVKSVVAVISDEKVRMPIVIDIAGASRLRDVEPRRPL